MNGMKKHVLLFSTLIWSVFTLSCAEKEAPNEDITFTLLIDNQSTRSVDIYLNSVLTEEGFVLSGTAFSKDMLEIPELVVNSQYIMRIVNSGRPVGEFFDERSFANLDPLIESITLNIPE